MRASPVPLLGTLSFPSHFWPFCSGGFLAAVPGSPLSFRALGPGQLRLRALPVTQATAGLTVGRPGAASGSPSGRSLPRGPWLRCPPGARPARGLCRPVGLSRLPGAVCSCECQAVSRSLQTHMFAVVVPALSGGEGPAQPRRRRGPSLGLRPALRVSQAGGQDPRNVCLPSAAPSSRPRAPRPLAAARPRQQGCAGCMGTGTSWGPRRASLATAHGAFALSPGSAQWPGGRCRVAQPACVSWGLAPRPCPPVWFWPPN